jgi:hypothetical protein
MASPPSDTLDIIAALRESAQRGDWDTASQLVTILSGRTPPHSKEEIREYLRHLNDALIAARASRARDCASLSRLKAAAKFNDTVASLLPARQNFGDATNS